MKICSTENMTLHKTKNNLITTKYYIKDLLHAKNVMHTGRLESNYNIRLKYKTKRIYLKFRGMYIRSICAILDHNHSINQGFKP
jgi:hypothetical protein